MIDLKKDFPIFENNPWLVFLDNAASTQKPSLVIDWVKEFLETGYANIHRWFYSLSDKSEHLYELSKDIIAKHIWWKSNEIAYTYNSTYAFNILAYSLLRSGFLKKWDKVLLSISEHHANLVPWLILKDYGIEVDYINITSDYDLDFEDFQRKYDDKVKVVSVTWVSNVSGTIFDVKKLWSMLRDDTIFAVDASQAVPNFPVNVQEVDCDVLIFTWHKVLAQTWIWVLWLKSELIKSLEPSFGWGGAIDYVKKDSFEFLDNIEWFEPWTPNIVWAVSILKSFEYIESIWGFEEVWNREHELTRYALNKFLELSDKIEIVGKKTLEWRLGVFSFVLKDWKIPSIRLWEFLAQDNICIRAWWHCAHPFMESLWYKWTSRMSLYFYNDFSDIDRFFDVLKQYL